MRNHSLKWILAATVLSLPLAIFAQTSPRAGPAKKRPASSAAPAQPDFSGVWFVDPYSRFILPKEDPPLQSWAKEVFEQHVMAGSQSDPNSGPDPSERCIPPGIPRTMLQPFPWEFVHARDRVFMLFEYQALTRQIFTDGRGHPKDLEPTYMGHSIGKYEGDTLVVDTIGLNDKTWLDPAGLPHSDALHVIERIRRVDHDTLVDDYTLVDPKAYTKPWTAQRVFKLKPDWQLQEYVCAENNLVK